MRNITSDIQFEVDILEIRQRIWQIIPGVLSWSTLIALTVLAFIVPFWIAIFVIAFDVYVLIRAVYMSVYLVYAYRQIREHKGVDWLERCRAVQGDLRIYIRSLRKQFQERRCEPPRAAAHGFPLDAGGETPHRRPLRDLFIPRLKSWAFWCWGDAASLKLECKQIQSHIHKVEEMVRDKREILDWKKVHHVVVVPTYDESLTVLRDTVSALGQADYPKEHMHVVVGFEERAGEQAKQKAKKLRHEFSDVFCSFITTFHPDGIPGEKRVKSANATWAIRKMEDVLYEKGVDAQYVVVSNFDSDTVAPPEYFSYLTYAFITHPDRYHVSYQPIPVYNNNLWDAPAFSRVVAMGSTFWQMIESTRPERMVTFSSHSMTLQALRDVGYWQTDIISEDSRIFWQCLIRYDGAYRTEPLYTTVSMDAALAPTWWKTLKNQYKQKRRWAWGIENFAYMVEGFLQNYRIPRSVKLAYLFRTLEGHYSWATVAIIVAVLGWLPVFFGGPSFHTTVLSYSLPYVARTLMTVAMAGLIVSATLTLLLLTPRSGEYSRWKYIGLVLQWALVPVIATILSAIPALDAETRLMLGRDLHFNVMEKARKGDIP